MYDVQLIKQRINCVDYARKIGLPIFKPGDRCVSPLRTEAQNKTSFCVDADFFYDFAGGVGGDVITFCAEYAHNGDRGAAIRELAGCTGVALSGLDRTEDWLNYTKNLCARTAFYHQALTDADREYLHSRRISDETIDRLMIGRVTDTYLKGRLFLPYFSGEENPYVCYYATRYMDGGAMPGSKYAKAKRDEFLQHVPWGLQTLTRPGGTLVIAEGYFDAVSFEQEGYPVLSAITGHFSKEQLPMVLSAARNFQRVFITYDNDDLSHAGEKFTARMAKTLMQNRIPFIVGKTPVPYHDVSDYYAAGNDLNLLLNNAVSGEQYICDSITDISDFSKFIRKLARYSDPAIVASLIENSIFSNREKQALTKSADAPPSESEISDEIISKYQLIYVEGDGFYQWDNQSWKKQTDTVIQNYADQQYGKRFTSAGRVGQVCKLLKARSVVNVHFNAAPVFAFSNGTLELNTGIFREPRQSDYCSIAMNYPYNASAKCPRWKKFIEDVTDGDPIREEALQMIAGYVLFPNCKHQKIFAFMGAGGNGKSVYLDVLQEVFGMENCTTIDPLGLCEDFKAIHIKSSLLNYAQEIDSDFSKAEKVLKTIADGKDLQACYKGKDHIIFRPRCKLIFSCNAVPQARTIAGMDRRMYFIEFPCKFVDDPNPKNPHEKQADIDIIPKLLKELPGIFNWVYEGYKLLDNVGYFTDTPEQAEYMRQFRESSNPIEAFIRDWEEMFVGEVDKTGIYTRYCQWCDINNHMKLSSSNFFIRFKQAMKDKIVKEYYPRIDGGRVRKLVFKE